MKKIAAVKSVLSVLLNDGSESCNASQWMCLVLTAVTGEFESTVSWWFVSRWIKSSGVVATINVVSKKKEMIFRKRWFTRNCYDDKNRVFEFPRESKKVYTRGNSIVNVVPSFIAEATNISPREAVQFFVWVTSQYRFLRRVAYSFRDRTEWK